MKINAGALLRTQEFLPADVFAVSPKLLTLKGARFGDAGPVLKGNTYTDLGLFKGSDTINWATIVSSVAPHFKGPPILGSYEAQRADAKYNSLSFFDKISFNLTMAQAASPQERDYIRKALAAGHSVSEIADFASQIRGKSPEWMQHNLRLVDDSSNGGKGIQQQWNDSCVPATAEALRGEFDPIYSLREHQANRDVNSTDAHQHIKIFPFIDIIIDNNGNGNLANEQRSDLDAHGGISVDRGAKGGKGMNEVVGLNELSSITGVTYVAHDATNPVIRALSLQKMDADLARGIPCALRINGGNGEGGHAVLVTGKFDGPPVEYAVHDPFSGKTVYLKESDLAAGNIVPPIAGWSKLADIDVASRGFLADIL